MESESFGSKVKRTTKKVIRVIIITLVIAAIGIFSFYYWGTYDEGFKSGRIISISHKGVIFKTYEGKINLETFGALKGASPIAESFDFSVEKGNDALIKDLSDAALNGEHVNLHFIKRYAAFPWRGDTKYFAVRVERLSK
ncbi:6-phosphogluconate dehydrogenase [Pseudochryseolinea flava]|uniref:6-phosphogluconate dehydrogenase n=1 Tax=Pseudochryseolinea flava TaxID=2059302 RepID=A0A364Y6U4_9BACT|nr:6-phosphogluconate dehydrogenase [Pseudochryseolinea flava]RAW02826.1 6-phosphogluconate dehydrogenase [Pseudochryseolinea flava]